MGNPPDNEIPVLTNADIDALVDTPAPFTNEDLSPITDDFDSEFPEEPPQWFVDIMNEGSEPEPEPKPTSKPTLAEMNAATRRVRR